MKKIVVLLLLIAVAAGVYVFISQKQNTNMEQPIAPVHSDDIGNPEDVGPDTSLVASESIVGTWQSDTDPKSTRIYGSDGTLVEMYDGQELSRGTWQAFSAKKPAAALSFALEADAVYIQETLANEMETNSYNFKVSRLTPDNLELNYMERMGTLTFNSVK